MPAKQLKLAKQGRPAAKRSAKATKGKKTCKPKSCARQQQALDMDMPSWVSRRKHELVQLPGECAPQSPKHGEFSYTIASPAGARVEVLLRSKAFYIKMTAAGEVEGSRHVSWYRDGDAKATWAALKERIGFA